MVSPSRPTDAPPRFAGETAAFATRHGKHALLAQPLEEGLGLRLLHVESVDTDAFGTFTGEVPRPQGPLHAARQKLTAALAAAPEATFALASEGSFGPHPAFPFIPSGQEWVLLGSRDGQLELHGDDLTADTNFAQATVGDADQARAFAQRVGFPSHALVVGARKGVADAGALEEALAAAAYPLALQTDMRAHLNPTRQRSILRAAQQLLARARSLCPRCGWPGFWSFEPLAGLPCAQCGRPTRLARVWVWRCGHCAHREERPVEGEADAGACDHCNP